MYQAVFAFASDLAAVKVDQHWGFTNRRGTMVIRPQFDEARNFSRGRQSSAGRNTVKFHPHR